MSDHPIFLPPNVNILPAVRTVLITGIVASFGFMIGMGIRDLLFATLDQWIPETSKLERKILRFVIISTLFTILTTILYRHTRHVVSTEFTKDNSASLKRKV